MSNDRVPTWDNIPAEDVAFFRSRLPGLRPVPGTLETDEHVISLIETVSDNSVGVGQVVHGNPDDGGRMGIYGVAELRLALELAEAHGAEAVHLVEGPRDLGGHPRLVLLCEDPDGWVDHRCILVAPREDVQREVV